MMKESVSSMSNEKRVQQAVEAFMDGKSCSQAVFCVYGPALGIPEEAALRISGAFGGGMGNLSEACGAATGAFMAIGAKGLPKEETYQLVQAFAKEFQAKYGSIHCTNLLGFDLSTENGREGRKNSGLGHEYCAQYVRGAAEILENLLFSDATK